MGVPVVLAIETSQRQGSVALRDADGVVHVEPLAPARRHDDDLLPAIDRLLGRQKLRPRDLDVVGVSIGPGGFTGLRIAVSTVKMFSLALDVQVVAVPSALVAAESCAEAGRGPIMVALASKKDSWWSTTLARDEPGDWRVQGEAALLDVGAFDPAGLALVVADQYFPAAARPRCEAAGVATIAPSWGAEGCVAVAVRLLGNEVVTEAARLMPLYARPPEAVTLWEQRERSER